VHRVVTIPNMLTALRFLLSGVLALLLLRPPVGGVAVAAFAIFLLAAGSDWIDGWLARRYQAETVLGQLMDPVADKVLVATLLVMLIPLHRLPAWVSLIILSRELVITGLRGVAATAGVVVAASNCGKIKSVIQYIGLGILLYPPELFPFAWLHPLGRLVMYGAVLLTIWSGMQYFIALRRLFFHPPANPPSKTTSAP